MGSGSASFDYPADHGHRSIDPDGWADVCVIGDAEGEANQPAAEGTDDDPSGPTGYDGTVESNDER